MSPMPCRSISWDSVFMPFRSRQPMTRSTPADLMALTSGRDAVREAEVEVGSSCTRPRRHRCRRRTARSTSPAPSRALLRVVAHAVPEGGDLLGPGDLGDLGVVPGGAGDALHRGVAEDLVVARRLRRVDRPDVGRDAGVGEIGPAAGQLRCVEVAEGVVGGDDLEGLLLVLRAARRRAPSTGRASCRRSRPRCCGSRSTP